MIVIVYLNDDGFAVRRDRYLEVVALCKGDWIKITEWIEQNGTFIGKQP